MKSFLSHTLSVSSLTLSLATHVWSSDSPFLDLPQEIHEKIFVELPKKDVGAISRVNKDLSKITQDPGFKKIYIDQILINSGYSADDLEKMTTNLIQEPFIKNYIDKLIKEVVKYEKSDINYMTDPFKKLAIAVDADRLFTPDMNGYNRAAIIAALTRVPADRVKAIAVDVDHLFTQDMKDYNRGAIIAALTRVPADRVKAIDVDVDHLFTPDMNGYNRSPIIAALAQVPADIAPKPSLPMRITFSRKI